MTPESEAVFVIDTCGSPSVNIYANLAEARGSVESFDIRDAVAFTESGELLTMTGTDDDLYADLQLTGQYDLLQSLLREVGPREFADDPGSYAREWFRLEALDSRRPPFVPRFMY